MQSAQKSGRKSSSKSKVASHAILQNSPTVDQIFHASNNRDDKPLESLDKSPTKPLVSPHSILQCSPTVDEIVKTHNKEEDLPIPQCRRRVDFEHIHDPPEQTEPITSGGSEVLEENKIPLTAVDSIQRKEDETRDGSKQMMPSSQETHENSTNKVEERWTVVNQRSQKSVSGSTNKLVLRRSPRKCVNTESIKDRGGTVEDSSNVSPSRVTDCNDKPKKGLQGKGVSLKKKPIKQSGDCKDISVWSKKSKLFSDIHPQECVHEAEGIKAEIPLSPESTIRNKASDPSGLLCKASERMSVTDTSSQCDQPLSFQSSQDISMILQSSTPEQEDSLTPSSVLNEPTSMDFRHGNCSGLDRTAFQQRVLRGRKNCTGNSSVTNHRPATKDLPEKTSSGQIRKRKPRGTNLRKVICDIPLQKTKRRKKADKTEHRQHRATSKFPDAESLVGESDDTAVPKEEDDENTEELKYHRVFRSCKFDPNLAVDDCDTQTEDECPLTPVTKTLDPTAEKPMDEKADAWEDDSDEDDELPDVFASPSTQQAAKLKVGDMMWFKYKQFPFWPSVIKSIKWKKKRLDKIRFLFIGSLHDQQTKKKCCNMVTVHYNPKNMVPFGQEGTTYLKMVEEGNACSWYKEDFNDAVNHAQQYLIDAALKRNAPLGLEYFTHGQEEDATDDAGTSQSRTSEVGNPAIALQQESWASADEDNYEDEENGEGSEDEYGITSSGTSNNNEALTLTKSKKLELTMLKRKMRCEKYVNFINTEEMKAYLVDIFTEKRQCARHTLFKEGFDRPDQKLGFGPIDDEEQQIEVLNILHGFFKSANLGSLIQNSTYIMQVWVPEAIVYALMRTSKYIRRKAEDMYSKGVRLVKEERKLLHKELLSKSATIAEEDKRRYDAKIAATATQLQRQQIKAEQTGDFVSLLSP